VTNVALRNITEFEEHCCVPPIATQRHTCHTRLFTLTLEDVHCGIAKHIKLWWKDELDGTLLHHRDTLF